MRHPMDTTCRDLRIAMEAVERGASVAMAKGGTLLASRSGQTIRPLIELLDEVGDEAKGAVVADKVLGRAAALVLATAHVKAVHGLVMSARAKEILEKANIKYSCDRLVEYISNRSGDGMCPIEQMSLAFDDAGEFLMAIREKYRMLSRG